VTAVTGYGTSSQMTHSEIPPNSSSTAAAAALVTLASG